MEYNLKMIQMNLFTKTKETHRFQKQTDGYQREQIDWGAQIGSLGLACARYCIWNGWLMET